MNTFKPRFCFTNNVGLNIFQCRFQGLFIFKSALGVDVKDAEVRFFIGEVIKRGGVISRSGIRGSQVRGSGGGGVVQGEKMFRGSGEVGLLEILGVLALGGEKGSLGVMDCTREVFRGRK